MQRYSVELLPGDSVVVGTDGLLDNMFEKETAAYVTLLRQSGNSQAAAQQLAELAHCRAKQTEGDTPFAFAARQAGRARPGGKMDDITVIVAHVLHSAAVPIMSNVW